MVRITLLLICILSFCLPASAQGLKDRETYRLWPGDAPNQQGQDPADIPVIQAFVPDEKLATGAAIVVCPGGGYEHLANHEGPVVGEWLAKRGIAAFVLRYRLGPKYHYPAEFLDAQRAMRFVRSHAQDWKLDPRRIGIMGFSAGGHLASTVATHFDGGIPDSQDPVERVSSRPDLQILIYPVITMGNGGHAGSKKNLLGENPSPQLADQLSNEKQVTGQTPEAFLVHSSRDGTVPVGNSDMYAGALYAHGVKYQYIRLSEGGHGFGLTKAWVPQFEKWLEAKGWAAKSQER